MLKRFSIRRWSVAALLPAVLCTGALIAITSAGATPPSYPPLTVHSASLTQGGRSLYWRVTLTQRFSFADLAPDGRKLCLQLFGASAGEEQPGICLADPHGIPRLAGLYVSPGRKIATVAVSGATVTASFLPAAAGLKYQQHLQWRVRTTGACGTVTSPGPCIGVSFFPSLPKRLATHVPKLIGCVRKGPDFVFNGSAKVHDIALTFDDGPWGSPPSIDFVNLLHQLHVPATFFEIGDQISEFDHNGAIERLMLADGDMIGDHTWTHPVMTTLSTSAQRSQLQLTLNKIKQETGFRTCIFRAPYGSTNAGLESLALSMGMTTIQWNDDSRDWSLPGTQAIYDTVIGEAHSGGIVIQHFGGGPRYETLAAIPEEVATLRSEGYKFVTVTQMLGYKLIYR
jgi:peptidoglycan-N-acetylglucosamine deacetylase